MACPRYIPANQTTPYPPHQQPQVALLFLTRGPLTTAPIWRTWFATAALVELHPNTVPSFVSRHGRPPSATPLQPLLDALHHTIDSGLRRSSHNAWLPTLAAAPLANCSDLAAEHDAVDVIAMQTLFSVYIHPAVGYTYCEGDLFAAHVLPDAQRVTVHWAQHSMVDAQRALLSAALEEPRNQRMVMLSDSCVPLYPPQVVYLQTLREHQSRINACKGDRADDHKLGMERWHDAMAGGRLDKHHWRKSSQWTTLTRQHADLVVKDDEIIHPFRWQCTALL